MSQPVLYSFRRCPYAMRARLAVLISAQSVELREILLRNKPATFLAASQTGTVPLLVLDDGSVEESLDIMVWALGRNDPQHWLDMPDAGHGLIAECDGPFKAALDRMKYHSRYDTDPARERGKAVPFLTALNHRLEVTPWLFGAQPTLADMAIVPFIRQFANVDRARFDAGTGRGLRDWLDRFLGSKLFAQIMQKYPPWHGGDPVTVFPPCGGETMTARKET